MNFSTLMVEENFPHILQVTLNRPEARNAINIEMMNELVTLWSELLVNPRHLRCIVLTGAEPAFCAGADLKARSNMDIDTWKMQHGVLQQAMLAMIDCPIPIIAAVNGAAFGGGLELALASDFVYAAKTAVFAQSEVKIGIIPGAMGTQHLPRACGLRRAKELTFTAMPFSAAEAYEWGIVNEIFEPEALMYETLKTANRICQNAPLAVQQAKKAMNVSQQLDIKAGYAFEVEAYHRTLLTKDRIEGIRAFNEKRNPEFIGE